MEIAATISSFVTHVKVEKGLSANTMSAYRRDLVKFEGFAKKRKLTRGDGQPRRSGGFSGWVVPGQAGKPDGGAAAGDPAEFLPLGADSGSDCERIRR